NISIALLRQVAQAMSLPIAELVREGAERPVELSLLLQRLERLAPEELIEAQQLLTDRFGEVAPGDRASRIALIGLRGAGKTTLGRRLAGELGVPFIELATEIERDAGMSLNEIFSLSGQAAYRRYERRTLENLLESQPRSVIATGGGLVSEPGTFESLLNACFTVWIKAAPEQHMERVIAQGDMRPMAGNAEAMEDLRRILAGRDALYAKADATVDTTDRDAEESFADLRGVVDRANGAAGPAAGATNKRNNA
ncbi:MAG: helix-turn-helix transcriptional regulator, partial [Alphaproteobacteria bacterium]